MPLIYTDDYNIELLTINPHISCMYVESCKQTGGGRNVAFLRNYMRGLPVTLRENYSTKGYFSSATQTRDKAQILKEFKKIQEQLWGQTVICLALSPFQKELEALEKRSPEVAKVLSRRMEYVREMFS